MARAKVQYHRTTPTRQLNYMTEYHHRAAMPAGAAAAGAAAAVEREEAATEAETVAMANRAPILGNVRYLSYCRYSI